MNKISEIKRIDIFEQIEAAKDIFNSFLIRYKETNSWKIRIIDSYILFCFTIFIITMLYVVLNGLFPMNAMLASLVCSIGSITLAGNFYFLILVALRMQIKTSDYSNEKAVGEYLFASLILYFVCINYLG